MKKPVSFNLSKILKEKGYEHFVTRYYLSDEILRENTVHVHYGNYGDFDVELNEFEENYNDGRVVTKSGNNCYGCGSPQYLEAFSAPTIGEVVDVIYEMTKIWISVYEYKDHAADVNDDFVFRCNHTGLREFKTPDEAYEAGIIVVINNNKVF